MKTSKKVALIVAAVLFGCGVVLAMVGLSLRPLDDKMSTFAPVYLDHTIPVSEDFLHIAIERTDCDVSFSQATDGACRVVCHAPSGVRHTAKVNEDTLTVREEDTRRWFEKFAVWAERSRIEIYLPKESYQRFFVTTSTGDITIPEWCTFDLGNMQSDTGDIVIKGATAQSGLTIITDTGDVSISDTNSLSKLNISSQTGDISLTRVRDAKRISIGTDTGDVAFKECSSAWMFALVNTGDALISDCTADRLAIRTDTGDVKVRNSDAGELSFTTTTGDVKGTLLSPKVFDIETSTGDVRVPPDGTDCGTCKISTSTGDIDIQIK